MIVNDYFEKKRDDASASISKIHRILNRVDDNMRDLSFYFKTHNDGIWDNYTKNLLCQLIDGLEFRVQTIKKYVN